MKFVIMITINPEAQNAPGGPDMANIFRWDLRRHLGSTEEGAENSGPSLATGTAADVPSARNVAQAYADYYALEEVYVYDTDAE